MQVSIDDVVDYAICPLKIQYKYKSEGAESVEISHIDFTSLMISILDRVLTYILILKGRQLTPTKGRVDRKFNLIWDELRPQVSFRVSPDQLLYIRKRVDDLIVWSERLMEVVAVRYASCLTVESNLGVNKHSVIGNITAVVVLRGEAVKSRVVVGVHSYMHRYPGLSNKHYTVQLFSDFQYHALRQDFGKLASVECSIIHRLESGSVLTASPTSWEDSKLILGNLVEGITSKIYYPRAEKISCRQCKYTKICSQKSV